MGAGPPASELEPGAVLPDSVVTEVDRLIAECEYDDTKVSAEERQASLDSVESYDLNGDAFTDYLIVDWSVACPIGVSYRHGNAGTGVIIMAGSADGAQVAGNAIAHGVRVEARSGAPDRVWLLLGGGYCGQDTQGVPRSEMQSCERPLEWNAERAEFMLAPTDP